MNRRDWKEAASLRRERALGGYTSVRATTKTHELLAELLRRHVEIRGLDELIYELAIAELERDGGRPSPPLMKPAVAVPTPVGARGTRTQCATNPALLRDYANPLRT